MSRELHLVNREIGEATIPPPEPPYYPEVHDMMSEAEHDALVVKKRRTWLLLVQDLKQRWEEYVTEAEHQDGLRYWDQFETPQDAADDFRLYEDVSGRIDG
jgi:hypothetical protein